MRFFSTVLLPASHALECIKPGLKVGISTASLRGGSWLSNLIGVRCHITVHLHADLTKDLLVHVFSLLISVRITNHLKLVLHHLLLHAHLFGFHSELLHNVLHLLWVHRCVNALHDCVDTFQRFDHLSVHLRCTQLRLNHPHLTRHGVIHVNLLS